MSQEFTYWDQLFGIPVAVVTLYLFYGRLRLPQTRRGYWLLAMGLLYSSCYLAFEAWKTGEFARITGDLFWPIVGGFILAAAILIALIAIRYDSKSKDRKWD